VTTRTVPGRLTRPVAAFATPPISAVLAGLLGATLLALAVLVATTPLGSGDYGQWLMAARPYAGLDVPPYRADAAVPPVVPLVIGAVQQVVHDPVATVHAAALIILVALGLAAFLAGMSLFDPLAGVLAAVAALLFSNLFLQLFAFGGLLQAGAIAFLWASVGTIWLARVDHERRRRWLTLGAIATGAGALTHAGTASIAVPTGVVITAIVVVGIPLSWRERAREVVPMAAVLAVVAAYWFIVLLPGGTDLARNPASLDYRGPSRLVDALTASWANAAVLVIGAAAIVGGTVGELRRRRVASWTALAAWTVIALAVLCVAVAGGVATDYPRFVTPIMAPFVIAVGAAVAIVLRTVGTWAVRRARAGSGSGWSVALAALLVAVAVPAAVGEFAQEARGYEVSDPSALAESARWINAHLPAQAVVLTTAREGKWIEGLSGRGTLFANSVRYNFRPDEWERSFAADALLQGVGGALVNEFFFAKLSDAGASDALPRGVVIAANHGGEYVDLLRTLPSATTVSDGTGTRLATLSNLDLETKQLLTHGDDALAESVWTESPAGGSVALHQRMSLRRGSSTFEIELAVPDSVPSGSIELSMMPGGGSQLDSVSLHGSEANLVYRPIGSGSPQLRIVASGLNAAIVQSENGALVAHADGRTLRLLVTDLTGAAFPTAGLQALDPEALVTEYDIQAALLRRDPSLAARERRLRALGFEPASTIGTYELLRRAPSP
jgi:hypothetical protein